MKPAVLCPLRYESSFAVRALRDCADVLCFGPYASGMDRAFASGELEGRPCVVLLGVGGGLEETEVCPALGRVVDRQGGAWDAPLRDESHATVVGVDHIVEDEASKRAMARETGASVVDMESHVFAREATARGMRWGVVRGVSDGPGDEFPAWIGEILDEHGGVRVAQVAKRIVISPSSIGVLRRIGKQGERAMVAACARARVMIEGAV